MVSSQLDLKYPLVFSSHLLTNIAKSILFPFFPKSEHIFQEEAIWKFYRQYLIRSIQTHKLTHNGTARLLADDLLRAIRNLIRFESTFLPVFGLPGCHRKDAASRCADYVLLQYLRCAWSLSLCRIGSPVSELFHFQLRTSKPGWNLATLPS